MSQPKYDLESLFRWLFVIIAAIVSQDLIMHRAYLLQALEHAKTREGFCAPNPAVGCVLVKDDNIIATGVHYEYGMPHAEVNALRAAGTNARGATAYITLEPCAHIGKTPPCTEALLEAGIQAVYFGFSDPNKIASGGAEQLRQAGILCQLLSIPEIDEFYQPYRDWVTTGKATLTAKLALSLDAKYAIQGQAAMITGDGLAQFTMEQRQRHDAIVTSINTVQIDNPKLNVRLSNSCTSKPIVVLDPLAELSLSAQIFETAGQVIILHTEKAPVSAIRLLHASGVICECISGTDSGRLPAEQLPELLGKYGFHSVWIETGTHWLTCLIQAEVLTNLYLYYGNKILGQEAISVVFPNTVWLARAQTIKWCPVDNEVYCKITLR